MYDTFAMESFGAGEFADFFPEGGGGGQVWDDGKEKYTPLDFLTHFIVPI